MEAIAPSKGDAAANDKKGGKGKKWCSVHNSTTLNDADCYQQGAPRPEKGKANVAAAQAPPLQFTGGFLFITSLNDQHVNEPSNNSLNFLEDCIATEQCVDDELILRLRDMLRKWISPYSEMLLELGHLSTTSATRQFSTTGPERANAAATPGTARCTASTTPPSTRWSRAGMQLSW